MFRLQTAGEQWVIDKTAFVIFLWFTEVPVMNVFHANSETDEQESHLGVGMWGQTVIKRWQNFMNPVAIKMYLHPCRAKPTHSTDILSTHSLFNPGSSSEQCSGQQFVSLCLLMCHRMANSLLSPAWDASIQLHSRMKVPHPVAECSAGPPGWVWGAGEVRWVGRLVDG